MGEPVRNDRCRILSEHVTVLKEDAAVFGRLYVLINLIDMLDFWRGGGVNNVGAGWPEGVIRHEHKHHYNPNQLYYLLV